jgi:hypothetical protein
MTPDVVRDPFDPPPRAPIQAPFLHPFKETTDELPSPRQGHAVRDEGTGRHRRRGHAARLRGRGATTPRRPCWRSAPSSTKGVVAPLNVAGRPIPSSFHDGKVTTTPGLQGRLQAVCAKAAGRGCSTRWTSAARACPSHPRRLQRDGQQRQHQLRAVPAADRRRHRGAADGRQPLQQQAQYIPKMIEGQLDRVDEPHRAAAPAAT